MKKHIENPERVGFLSGSRKSDRRRRRFVYILVAAVSSELKSTLNSAGSPNQCRGVRSY